MFLISNITNSKIKIIRPILFYFPICGQLPLIKSNLCIQFILQIDTIVPTWDGDNRTETGRKATLKINNATAEKTSILKKSKQAKSKGTNLLDNIKRTFNDHNP